MALLCRIAAACAALALSCLAQAAPTLVTTPAALAANDSVNWSQLGIDGTTVGASFSATSANSWAISGALAGTDACVSVVSTGAVCGWTATTGFASGDSVIWAESGTTFAGTGPVTLSFAAALGAGLYMQASSPGSFTASITAFNGATNLGTFTSTSPNGSGLFIGVLDTVANVTRIQVAISSCAPGCDASDFAVNTLLLKEAAPVPELPTSALLGLGLLALPWVRSRATAASPRNQEVQA